MNIKKSSFYPVKSLENKSNYKRYYRIERDGSIFERIFLDIPDPAIREQLICMHYMQYYVRVFLKELIGINIISRDNPWDFKIEIVNKEIFNIEITSIADDKSLFEKIKREERFAIASHEDKIPLHELEKLNKLFPKSEINKKLEELKKDNLSKKDLVDNPYKNQVGGIFLSSTFGTQEPLENLLREAIQKKEDKKHSEKEKTVLIVDNRTMIYEIKELHEAVKKLDQFLENSSFREIWFYTGYYTELDGNGGEYSFSPMKITELQSKTLTELSDRSDLDENGLIYV